MVEEKGGVEKILNSPFHIKYNIKDGHVNYINTTDKHEVEPIQNSPLRGGMNGSSSSSSVVHPMATVEGHLNLSQHMYIICLSIKRYIKMASRLAAARLPHRLPILAGVCSSSTAFTVDSVPHFSKSVKKLKGKRRVVSRRLLLGLGASFWAQFMSMSASDGIGGGRFFMASARQQEGASSPVEKVGFFAEFGFGFSWILIF